MDREIVVRDLGLTEYPSVHTLQRELQAGLREIGVPAILLLTEHQPVITLGRAHPEPALRVSVEQVARTGIPIVQTERGGDITYHGPGQLVAYPILDLRAWDLELLGYVAGLERAVILMLARFGIVARARRGARGVWTGDRKIASLGIHVRRWVTMHGVAINVAPNMAHFGLIEPCGMASVEMTSMACEGGASVPLDDVKRAFVDAFAEVFACRARADSPGAPVRSLART